MKPCPFCAEDIKEAAVVCKHCGRDVAGTDARESIGRLDKGIRAYRLAGFNVFEKTSDRANLVKPRKFDLVMFIIFLLVFWPLALVEVIIYATSSDKRAFLQILPDGTLHESGHTLAVVEDIKLRRRRSNIIVLVVLAGVAAVGIVSVAVIILANRSN